MQNKSDDIKFVNDEQTYKELSEPYKTNDDAKTALQDFTEALRQLRVKHRIPELRAVAAVYTNDQIIPSVISFGDQELP